MIFLTQQEHSKLLKSFANVKIFLNESIISYFHLEKMLARDNIIRKLWQEVTQED